MIKPTLAPFSVILNHGSMSCSPVISQMVSTLAARGGYTATTSHLMRGLPVNRDKQQTIVSKIVQVCKQHLKCEDPFVHVSYSDPIGIKEGMSMSISNRHVEMVAASEDELIAIFLFVSDDYRSTPACTLYTSSPRLQDPSILVKRIYKSLPPNKKYDPNKDKANVNVGVSWVNSQGEVHTKNNRIKTENMERLLPNYPDTTAAGLRRLALLDKPWKHGKIIIWHGPPGTGKTHAALSLAKQWSIKFGTSVECIADPERLFNNTDYLFDRITAYDNVKRDGEASKLIVIEDAAELFSVNARGSAGFSRFLNTLDGILGHGVNTIFLLTANEPVERIEPALLRPGRCIQELEFGLFNAEEATTWLRDHGSEEGWEGSNEVTLAEMYHTLQSRVNDKRVKQAEFGFVVK